MRRWTVVVVVLLVSVGALAGCATPGQRAANWQNEDAGAQGQAQCALLYSTLTDAAQAVEAKLKAAMDFVTWCSQTFKDVQLNAKAIRTGQGDPEEKDKVPYSPEKSKQTQHDAQDPWWKYYVIIPLAVTAQALIQRAAAAYCPWLAGIWGKVSDSLIMGIAKGRTAAETKTDGAEALKSVLDKLQSEQQKAGVLGFVSDLAKKAEDELGLLDHKVTLSS
jgi:hypothetical protein